MIDRFKARIINNIETAPAKFLVNLQGLVAAVGGFVTIAANIDPSIIGALILVDAAVFKLLHDVIVAPKATEAALDLFEEIEAR